MPTVDFGSALGLGNETGTSRAEDVAADSAGNSYMTGNFSGTVDFDPSATHVGDTDILTAAGGSDIYVAKYAPDNSLVWAMRMGGSLSDFGRGIEVDSSGNVYVTGGFQDAADFGSMTLTSAGIGRDGFAAKLNPAGTVLWANRWGQANYDASIGEDGKDVDTDASGNVYVSGFRYDNQLGYRSDILKYSSNGTAQWAKYIDTNYTSTYSDIVADAAGNSYIVGQFSGTVDFDPNSTTKWVSDGLGQRSGFVLKLTTAGKLSWVAPFVSQDSSSSSTAGSIDLDPSGNVIVSGHYGGTVDFNPGSGTFKLPTISGGTYFAKLTANGNFVWARGLGSGPIASVKNLVTDAAGNIYATGSFTGTLDFDSGTGVSSATSVGGSDAFVLKLSSSGDYVWHGTFGGSGDDIGWGIDVDQTGTIHFAGQFSSIVDFNLDPLYYFELDGGTTTNSFLVRLTQN